MASQNFVTLQSIHHRAKQTRIQETEPTHFKHHTPLQEKPQRNRGLPGENAVVEPPLRLASFNLGFTFWNATCKKV